MEIFSSCKKAIDSCISQKKFAVAHLYKDEQTMDIHIHDCYEMYFSVSGGKQFLIDNRFYDVSPGDVFFINQFESHHLTQIDRQTHERFVISIYPDFLRSLGTADTDLDACFREHPPKCSHKISLSPEEQNRFLFYISSLKDIDHEGFGSDLAERSAFTLFMVYMARLFHKYQDPQYPKTDEPVAGEDILPGHSFQVDGILSYINQHIEEPLSLEQIASQFYLNSTYMCRIFKSVTGTTINKYITAKRITHAKQLLADGCAVSIVSGKCGYSDYSSFFKAFKKVTGISPKKYAQISAEGHL